jgi:hypothetical protein
MRETWSADLARIECLSALFDLDCPYYTLSKRIQEGNTMHQGMSLLKSFAEIQTAGFPTQKYRNNGSSSGAIFKSMGDGSAAGTLSTAIVLCENGNFLVSPSRLSNKELIVFRF